MVRQHEINLSKLPVSEKYELRHCIRNGVFGTTFEALEKDNGRKVAVKIQKFGENSVKFIEREYEILDDFSSHPNLVDFYGIYGNKDEVWFALEACEGGSVNCLVNKLLSKNRRMSEDHIGYILKETLKALIYLHENKIIHRNINASNILLTKEGEVKLTDFEFATVLLNTTDITKMCLGSPSWMAPEIIRNVGYNNKIDVWALGMTAIELGDGQVPYQFMHPTRSLFQIVRNPPPNLNKLSHWSNHYVDFIEECLEKNPEYRPFVIELAEHPFLQQIPDNNHHLSLEIKALVGDLGEVPQQPFREFLVNEGFIKRTSDGDLEEMLVEDLAALENISEENVLKVLEQRFKIGEYQTFIGDVLLSINLNEKTKIFGNEYHHKYEGKSRSDNAPHIYAIADSAYENVLHHQMPQKILLSGESGAGKTSNYLHIFDHLLFLGNTTNININRLKDAVKLIHSLINAVTPTNFYSTRAVFKTNLTFGQTGKISGAIFDVFQLEKWRVSSVDMFQGNFYIFYYIYDGLKEENKLEQFQLKPHRNYRYLRVTEKEETPQNDIVKNVLKFRKIQEILKEFQFKDEEISTFFSVIAAILLIGEIRFTTDKKNISVIENEEILQNISDLLEIDVKKLHWALTKYCFVKDETAIQQKNNADQARNTRDVFANNLYARMVDYIIFLINEKLSLGRKIFGEKFSIEILDFFGFESFKRNHLPQLFVNCFNEQLQYHYIQRIVSWEFLDLQEEDIEFNSFHYYNNKNTLDHLLGKTEGLFSFIDEASKSGQEGKYITDSIENQDNEYVKTSRNSLFSIAHYTGKVTYDATEMPDKNRDFVSPEITETLRLSNNPIIKCLFTKKLNRTGNLIFNNRNFQNAENREFSQSKKMRTSIATFRALSLDLLKELSVGSSSGGTHFVRCVRSNLDNKPKMFHKEMIKQQLRALSVLETAKVRQNGFPQRIPFSEFLRRYKHLAFDFNENTAISRDNCRLLLIRLKMEGWQLGKTKVFLTYYNEEYLARLYETHVKKIIKIQSIIRTFLAKCQTAKIKTNDCQIVTKPEMSEDEAATIIQQAYKKTILKSYHSELCNHRILSEQECTFIKHFAKKWKSSSLFHVLMRYRAAKFQEIFGFSQQVHYYNLNVFHYQTLINVNVNLNSIDRKAQVSSWIGDPKPTVLKLPFRLAEMPFYDTTLLDSLTRTMAAEEANWDTPYQWRKTDGKEESKSESTLISLPFSRDPTAEVVKLPIEVSEKPEIPKMEKDYKNELVKNKPNIGKKKFDNQDMFNGYSLKKSNDINSRPANQDFDYIKAPVIKSKPKVDPVSELRSMARQNFDTQDDPPFNFQGMLRKTNFRRDSLNRTIENYRHDSFKMKQERNEITKNEKKIAAELVPGIFIEGFEVEL